LRQRPKRGLDFTVTRNRRKLQYMHNAMNRVWLDGAQAQPSAGARSGVEDVNSSSIDASHPAVPACYPSRVGWHRMSVGLDGSWCFVGVWRRPADTAGVDDTRAGNLGGSVATPGRYRVSQLMPV
jgi:hypothetical protein